MMLWRRKPRASTNHLPALDGVRGVAVLMVFLVHYGGGAKSSNFLLHTVGVSVQAGWSGVTFFFILSGFLISGILWDSRKEPHFWRNFYMRRTLRIFPVYYASLLLVLITAVIAGNARFALTHIYVYALYLQNMPLPFNAKNLGSPLEMSHFWSLAVRRAVLSHLAFSADADEDAETGEVALPRYLCVLRSVSHSGLVPASCATRRCGDSIAPNSFTADMDFLLSRAGELAAGAYLAMRFRDSVSWPRLKAGSSLCMRGLGWQDF